MAASSQLKKVLLVIGVLAVAQALFFLLGTDSTDRNEDLPLPSHQTMPPAGVAPTIPPATPTPARKGLTADMVAALPDSSDSGTLAYDSSGKRDPFRPFDFAPKQPSDESLTPLERYELGQLKLTAVLDGFDEPTAIVENAAGKGFTVKRGTKIGPNGGTIVEILKDRLLIDQSVTDFTGETKTTRIELAIRTQDQNERKP